MAAAVEEKEEIDNNLKASETRQAEYEKELEECKEKLAAERSPAAIVKLECKKEDLEADIALHTRMRRSLEKQKDRLVARITEFDALKQQLGAGHERAARPCLSLPVTRLVLCAAAYCAAFQRFLSLFFFCSGFVQSHTHTRARTYTNTRMHVHTHTSFPSSSTCCLRCSSRTRRPRPTFQIPPPSCLTTASAERWRPASEPAHVHGTWIGNVSQRCPVALIERNRETESTQHQLTTSPRLHTSHFSCGAVVCIFSLSHRTIASRSTLQLLLLKRSSVSSLPQPPT